MQQISPRRLKTSEFLEFLVANDLLDAASAKRAQHASSQTETPIENTLMEFGLIGEDELYRALALHLNMQFISHEQIDTGLLQQLSLPLDFLKRADVLPAYENEKGLVLAVANPRASDTFNSIAFQLDAAVLPAIATPSAIRSILQNAMPENSLDSGKASTSDVERLTAIANEGPVIKLVNDLIGQAADKAASDIHIEAEELDASVRFRIDGILVPSSRLPSATFAAVASRLKVMARLNISEKRRPQDGRAQVSVRGRAIDIRLSTLPTQYGESIVLRLLDRKRLNLDWLALGFGQKQIAKIEAAVGQPNGIFLVAGPTGSGKTTTLYTALSGLNSKDRKIVTVEDPIEYALDGVNQVQVEPEVDMGFARALRAILRQDPDVIMVGEIRDEETAEIATRAALVGRMVLSTIHTNDALSAVARLRDLGIPPYLLAATLRGVLAQRLVRKTCSDCEGQGCAACQESGQRGRTVLSEFLEINPEIASCVSRNGEAEELMSIAEANGFVTMKENARQLVSAGVASQEEVLRATGTF